MFSIFASFLTGLAVMAILLPLSRKTKQSESADAYDLTVYKSQLKEIDGDLERGLIAEKEAEAARAEVARRLLKSQAAMEADDAATVAPKSQFNVRVAAVIALLVVPVCAGGLYLSLGSPGLESQPLSARLEKDPEKQSLMERVASVERVLTTRPDDLRGWKLLAPIYLSMRRPNDAIRAFQNIIRLEGETVENLGDLGEAIVVGGSGLVSQEAIGAFLRANRLDPKAPKPRFFLAIALGQQDKNSEAIEAWKSLLEDSQPDSVWVPFAREQIASLEKKMTGQSSRPQLKQAEISEAKELKGPTRDDMKAAADLSSEERQEMIQSMVNQLSERLDNEGGTADEWVRLIRAELVLKRPDMAAKTVNKALKAMQSDIEGLAKIKASARSLGLSINQ